jgi:hypothetical protein
MASEKHLDFLQAAITRMAGNSFQTKAWSVAVASATVAFAAAKDSDPRAAVLGVVPIIAFWALDAYYLALERLFRDKYNSVRMLATPSDFDMSPGPVTAALVLKAGVRPAVWVLHLPMVVLVGLVTLKGCCW